jgi:hypothetical protein
MSAAPLASILWYNSSMDLQAQTRAIPGGPQKDDLCDPDSLLSLYTSGDTILQFKYIIKPSVQYPEA